MTAQSCPCGADLAGACLDCLTGTPPERPNPPDPALQVVSRPFPARHPGQCPGCDLPIREGETIVRMGDDTHRHGRCAT